MMLTFHVIVQSEAPATGLPVTFDAAMAALASLPRLFIEADGSFVWRGAADDGTPWQVDGNLIDQGPCLAYVELAGHCPTEQFDLVLKALGWPDARLAYQLPRQGTIVAEAEFRRQASGRRAV